MCRAYLCIHVCIRVKLVDNVGLTEDCRHLAANAYIHISEAFNCQKYISHAQFGVSAYFDRTPLKGVNPLIL